MNSAITLPACVLLLGDNFSRALPTSCWAQEKLSQLGFVGATVAGYLKLARSERMEMYSLTVQRARRGSGQEVGGREETNPSFYKEPTPTIGAHSSSLDGPFLKVEPPRPGHLSLDPTSLVLH